MKNTTALELIKQRRSSRVFLKKPVEKKIIQQIIECGQHAPSAFDSQPWEFIIVRQKAKIAELLSDRVQNTRPPYHISSKKFASTYDQNYGPVIPPPVLIILVGDRQLCPYIASLICSITCCGENMLLAASALGLGACWLYVYDPDDVAETEVVMKKKLGLPKEKLVLSLIACGYSDYSPTLKVIRKSKMTWL